MFYYIKWLLTRRHSVSKIGLTCLCHSRPMRKCRSCGFSVFTDTLLGPIDIACPNCLRTFKEVK